jgi:putative hydrolase of the HAD superfamily
LETNRYKWILFDLTQVIIEPVFSEEKYHLVQREKVSSSILAEIFNLPQYEEYILGQVTHSQLLEAFCKKYVIQITEAEFAKLITREVKVIEGIEKLLIKLSNTYSLGMLTNEGNELARLKISASRMETFFKEIIISANIGIKKPDKEFYRKSLELLHALPEECIFIDDSPVNCERARSEGINSIVFGSYEQLEKDLFQKLK